MAILADLALSGPGWLENSGACSPTLIAKDGTTPSTTLTTISMTTTVYDGITSVASGAVALVAGALVATTGTPSPALDASKVYTEVWSGTVNGTTFRAQREARVSRYAAQRRLPLVTTSAVVAGDPILATYASGETSWEDIIALCHAEMMYRLWREGGPSADLLEPGQCSVPLLYLVKSRIYAQASVNPGDAYTAAADRWAIAYRDWWEGAALLWDTDGDGDADPGRIRPGGMGPSTPGPGRV